MRTVAFVLAMLCLAPNARAACEDFYGTCDFYRCMEEKEGCGPKGYYQKFADPYCRTYVEREKYFTPGGQTWLQDVRLCLQVVLAERQKVGTCDETRAFAIASHKGCYLETGFCDLSYADQMRVVRVAWREAVKPNLIQMFVQIQKQCVKPPPTSRIADSSEFTD